MATIYKKVVGLTRDIYNLTKDTITYYIKNAQGVYELASNFVDGEDYYSITTNVAFRPVRGLQKEIDNYPYTDGNYYFAVDTGKMYVDANGKRIGAGTSGSSVYVVDITSPEEATEDGIYELDLTGADGDVVANPKEDDLLITSDGSFYRVLSWSATDSSTVLCTRIAISGSGGGGGTGPGSLFSPKAKIEKIDPESSYLINGRKASIKVKAISGKDPDDGTPLDKKLTIYWSLSEVSETGVEVEYAHDSFPIDASTDDEEYWVDFEYGTKSRNSATNVLKMYAKGSSSTESRSFSYEFHTTELKLLPHSSFTNNNIYSPDDVTIYSTLVGNVDKFIYYYFDGVLLNEGGTLLRSTELEPTYHVDPSLCTHGNHTVRIEVYQSINDTVDMTSSAEPIEMEIAVVNPADERPVIWLGDYAKEYYQYDSIKIPFNVYDPKNSKDTLVRFFKNSTKIKESTVARSTSFSTFEIVNADLNEVNYYYIKAGEVELAVEREISFLLSEDPNRKGMKINENGLIYSFTASGHSNSDSATNRTKDENGNELGIFEDFNWYSNGWDKDEDDGNAILRISNNAKFKYNLGATKFATTKSSEQSHTFEFQFKVRNVQDYANIVHNITRYQGLTDDRYTTYPTWTDLTPMPDDNFIKSTRVDANGDTVKEYYGTFDIWDKKLYLENDWSGKNFVYENYDAFLQWFLPYFAEKHPDLNKITVTPDGKSSGTMPTSYDDIEFRKIDKLLTTNFAAGKYYDGSKGILLGAQDAIFTNGTDTVNVSYVEDKLINLTVVYSHGEGTQDGANMLMSIYLNGVLTGVSRSTLYEGDAAVPWTIGNDDTYIEFNSQYCDFELYKIRYYNRALNIPEILTNYAVDLKDTTLYDETTQLAVSNKDLGEYQFSYANMIAYNNEHPDDHLMPYIVFDTEVASDGDALPYSKATPIHYVNMTFVNPALDRAYTTGRLKALATEAGQTEEEYYIHHCPSWTAKNVDLSVQGTSSEFYPRRNYKAKTQVKLDAEGKFDSVNGKKQNMMRLNRGPFAQAFIDDPNDPKLVLPFFYYDNNTVGTNKFTLKIDYMESSGSYNMGFANLVYNAYTHHPLWYYNKANAFVTGNPAKKKEITPTSYDPNTQYNYYNHKGNIEKWINKDTDGLHMYTAEELAYNGASYTYEQQLEAFLKGPRDLAILQNVSKVLGGNKGTVELSTDAINAGVGEESVNKWYSVEPATYSDYQFENLSDYRTSVQGIRTLAFHKKKDGSIIFIGMYNMLLDKGSDEAYGFKPLDKVKTKYVLDDKGNPKDLADVAECWEFENNSRGFCSFRDASTNRTDNKFFDTGTYTAKQAPLVADYFEYRYNCNDDALDVIYNLSDELTDADSIKTVKDAFGVDISDQTDVPGTSLKKGVIDAGQAMLGAYAN